MSVKVPLEQLAKTSKRLLENPSFRLISDGLRLLLDDLNAPYGDTTAFEFHRGNYREARDRLETQLTHQTEVFERMKRVQKTPQENKDRQAYRVAILKSLVRFLDVSLKK